MNTIPSMRSFIGYGALSRRLKTVSAICVALAIAVPAHAETVIAALGDSLTQGYGLPAADGFVPQLEAYLDAHGQDTRVINAGVSGDTTAGGLSRIEWTLTEDVQGLIVALGGNDLLRGIDPAVSRANLRGILEIARARDLPVLLIGLPAPGNYGPDYKAEFDAIYPDLAAEFATLLHPNFLGAIARKNAADGSGDGLMQSDGIHPNALGVIEIVGDIGPKALQLVQRAVGD